jgi:hypothetical protein
MVGVCLDATTLCNPVRPRLVRLEKRCNVLRAFRPKSRRAKIATACVVEDLNKYIPRERIVSYNPSVEIRIRR